MRNKTTGAYYGVKIEAIIKLCFQCYTSFINPKMHVLYKPEACILTTIFISVHIVRNIVLSAFYVLLTFEINRPPGHVVSYSAGPVSQDLPVHSNDQTLSKAFCSISHRTIQTGRREEWASTNTGEKCWHLVGEQHTQTQNLFQENCSVQPLKHILTLVK